jgi:hypothetical protein
MPHFYRRTTHKKLLLGDRLDPTKDAEKMQKYTLNLDDPVPIRDANHSVEMSRHHIIPDLMLRAFWNAVAEAGHLDFLAGNLLKQLQVSLRNYPFSNQEGKDGTVVLLGKIRGQDAAEKYVHDPKAVSAECMDDLNRFFTWMPGNIFVGPRERNHDPKDQFDSESEPLVRSDFHKMKRAYDSMQQYNSMVSKSSNLVSEIGRALAVVAGKTDFIAFDRDYWVLKGGKYSIVG